MIRASSLSQRSLLVAALSATSLGAFAQEVRTPGGILEQVIVTSQKRAQSLQDVPISLVALNKEQLEIKGIDDLMDIGASIPNLYINPFNNNPSAVRLFIRGIGQNGVQITQDPSVALYLDGVYIGSTFGSGFEGVDIERIEVLRGPQGTLYGRNATGGAVNIVTSKANLDVFEFKQQLTFGDYGAFKSKTTANIPLTDTTAFKIAYLQTERDGIVENQGPGEDFGSEDRKSLVADLLWSPQDFLSLNYRHETSEILDSQRFQQVIAGGAGSPLADLISLSQEGSDRLDKTASRFAVQGNEIDIAAHTVTADWEISENTTIRSITALRDMESRIVQDHLPTASVNFGFGDQRVLETIQDVDFKQLSQELQFIGGTESLEYVVGLYYYTDEGIQDGNETIVLGSKNRADFTSAENESIALYTQGTYTPDWLDNRWHFTLGARYSRDKRKSFRINLNSASFATSAPDGADYDEDFSNFNPSLTVAYDFSDDINLYGKVVSGYKAGGTSIASTNAELFRRGFDEEEILSYELGLKGDFFERRARLNAAVFHMELEGLQSLVQTGPTTAGRDFFPVDGNTMRGLEFDLSVILADPLTLSIGYGYLDSKLGQDQIISPVATFQLADTMAYAPEHSFTIGIDYYKNLRNGALFGNLSYSYRDRASTSINLSDYTEVDDYGLLDVAIGWTDIRSSSLPGSFKFMLWGKNLADDEYYLYSTAAFSFADVSDAAVFGDPRTVGLSLYYNY